MIPNLFMYNVAPPSLWARIGAANLIFIVEISHFGERQKCGMA